MALDNLRKKYNVDYLDVRGDLLYVAPSNTATKEERKQLIQETAYSPETVKEINGLRGGTELLIPLTQERAEWLWRPDKPSFRDVIP